MNFAARTFFGAALAAGLLPFPAGAQSGGDQPLRVIVPYAPGGAGDLIGRTVANKLGEQLGRQAIVENRPGAGGMLGVQVAVKMPADGNTLVVTGGQLAVAVHLQALPFDPLTDLTPVGMVGTARYAIAVNAAVPAQNIAELVALAKQRPEGLSYATTGVGSVNHLAGELLKSMSGANLVAIPYKGATPAATALVANEVPMAISDLANLMPQANAGKVRILAVVNTNRAVTAPNVPTVAESGFPGYAVESWTALFAAAGSPREAILRLNRAIDAAVSGPDVRSMLLKAGVEPMPPTTIEQMRASLAEDVKKWGQIIKTANIKVQ